MAEYIVIADPADFNAAIIEVDIAADRAIALGEIPLAEQLIRAYKAMRAAKYPSA